MFCRQTFNSPATRPLIVEAYGPSVRTTSEYDAFGPWIDEVHTVDDLPRLYRNAGIDPAAHRLVLKIPREIARRDATPDTHLYDHLIAVGDSAMTVLSRRGETYAKVQVPFDSITAIEDSVALLDGWLLVHTLSGAVVSIPYNGSASAPIRSLVRTLRELYLPTPGSPAPENPATGGPADPVDHVPPDLAARLGFGVSDTDLVTATGKLLAREPGLVLMSAVPRRPVTPTSGWANQLKHHLWPMAMQAAVVLADDREVRVLHRRDWFSRTSDSVYSLAQTVVPRARITAVQVLPHERYWRIQVVVVYSGNARVWFPASAGPATDALLAAFAGPLPRAPGI